MTPKQAAFKLLGGYKLSVPTLDNLHYIIGETGYELIDYDPQHMTNSLVILTEELGITAEILQQKAFAVTTGATKLLFIQEGLDTESKRVALAHELGHIICGHLLSPNRNPTVKDEYEANEFAHYLLHPSPIITARAFIARHSRLVFMVLLVAAILIVGGVVRQRQQVQERLYGEYYATPTGTKYHKPGCSSIKTKTNLHRVTVEEIEAGKYTPCKLCITE